MRRSKTDRPFTLTELAEVIGGSVEGDGQTIINDIAPIESAGPHDLSFVANIKYATYVESTQAGALILDPDTPCPHKPVIRHVNPYLAFARVVALLYPNTPLIEPGINPSSVTSHDSDIDSSARVGAFCHIRESAQVGKNSQLVSSVYVGRNVTIGDDCLLYPGVRILDNCSVGNRVILHAGVVVGSDGFGYAPSDSGVEKISQIGWVEIGNDVEIGANTTIDRGAIGATKIGSGTKIDNLVQIAHNVEIGRHCIIVSQVGISGSTKIGDGVTLAGQVGLVGHIEIGDDSTIAAQSGVTKSLVPGSVMLGSPAKDIKLARRIEVSLKRLPDLLKRVKKLEDTDR